MGKESTATERPRGAPAPKKTPSFSLKRMIGRKLDRSSSSPNVNNKAEKAKEKNELAASSEHTRKRTKRMPSSSGRKRNNAGDELAAAKDFERMLQRHAVEDLDNNKAKSSPQDDDLAKGSSHHSKKSSGGSRFQRLLGGGGRTSASSKQSATTTTTDEDLAAAKNFESMLRHTSGGTSLLDGSDSFAHEDTSLSSHAADPFLTGDPAVAKLLRHASSGGVASGGAQPRLDRAVSAPGAVAVAGIGGGASSYDEEEYQEYCNDNSDNDTKKDSPNNIKSLPPPDEQFVPVMEATLVMDEDAEQVQAMKDLMQEKNSQLQQMEKELEAMRKALASSAIVAEPLKTVPVKAEPIKAEPLQAARQPPPPKETRSSCKSVDKETVPSYRYDNKLTNEENFAMEMLLGGGSNHASSKSKSKSKSKPKPKRTNSKSNKPRGSKFGLLF